MTRMGSLLCRTRILNGFRKRAALATHGFVRRMRLRNMMASRPRFLVMSTSTGQPHSHSDRGTAVADHLPFSPRGQCHMATMRLVRPCRIPRNYSQLVTNGKLIVHDVSQGRRRRSRRVHIGRKVGSLADSSCSSDIGPRFRL